MSFHIYCETSNFASVSASFLLGVLEGGNGKGVSIGFRGFDSVKFENRTVVGSGTY